MFAQITGASSAVGRSRAHNHPAICFQRALITAGMTCKGRGMSGRIHSQWHCSAASHSLHTSRPSKKCHPLWSPQHSSPNPLPFDQRSSDAQQSRGSADISGRSPSVSPAFHPSDCLPVLFSVRGKPTRVFTLSRRGRPSPRRAGHRRATEPAI